MVWVIVAAAVVVLGLGAWAGTGRLGSMPEVVNDRAKGHIPEGPVDQLFLSELEIPQARSGYRPQSVDKFLQAFVDGEESYHPDAVKFPVQWGGYDMQVVDHLCDRIALQTAEPEPAEPDDEPVETDVIDEPTAT